MNKQNLKKQYYVLLICIKSFKIYFINWDRVNIILFKYVKLKLLFYGVAKYLPYASNSAIQEKLATPIFSTVKKMWRKEETRRESNPTVTSLLPTTLK